MQENNSFINKFFSFFTNKSHSSSGKDVSLNPDAHSSQDSYLEANSEELKSLLQALEQYNESSTDQPFDSSHKYILDMIKPSLKDGADGETNYH